MGKPRKGGVEVQAGGFELVARVMKRRDAETMMKSQGTGNEF